MYTSGKELAFWVVHLYLSIFPHMSIYESEDFRFVFLLAQEKIGYPGNFITQPSLPLLPDLR